MPSPRSPEPDPQDGSAPYIPHSRPDVGEAEAEALGEVIASRQLAQGPRVERLERDLAKLLETPEVGQPRAVALCSGTAALYAALRALGAGQGDEILLPAYACASVYQAVRYLGCTPRFVDCDPSSFNLDPDDARRRLTARTRACVVAHLFGLPADLAPLLELGVPLIEDCAQAIAADYRGRPVGTYGEAATFSFYATKLAAAGEGGMVASSGNEIIERVRSLRNCEEPFDQGGQGDEWAFNFKMSDLHAAVALVQLQRLPKLLEERQVLARRYREGFADLPLTLPPQPEDREHQHFRFVVSVRKDTLDALLEACESSGLACRRPVGWLAAPVRERLDELPGCRQAWETACSVPLYPSLTDAEATSVVERFRRAVRAIDV